MTPQNKKQKKIDEIVYRFISKSSFSVWRLAVLSLIVKEIYSKCKMLKEMFWLLVRMRKKWLINLFCERFVSKSWILGRNENVFWSFVTTIIKLFVCEESNAWTWYRWYDGKLCSKSSCVKRNINLQLFKQVEFGYLSRSTQEFSRKIESRYPSYWHES